MDKHNEIHGTAGGAGETGFNPCALMVAANEAEIRSDKESGNGASNGLAQSEMTSGGLSSFSLYWDVAAGGWKCHEPIVVGPDGSVLDVDEPEDGYENGTYYLHVKFDSEEEAYTAEIKTGGASGSDDEIAVIKLFTIADTEEDTEQYHTGVVNLHQMTITGEEGETEGSDPTPVGGQVYMSGDASSGLIVKTFKKSNGEKHVCLDIEGRESGDAFGIHDVNGSDGSPTGTKVFATADIDLEAGGGEGEVDVITGISFEWDGNNLVCKLKKKTISGVTAGEEFDGDDETVCEGEAMNVVTDVEYTSGHTLDKTVVKGVTILASGGDAAETETVFETTPHSGE